MANFIIVIIFIWWGAIIVTAFKNNSASILSKNNIPFKARGLTASKKSVREVIEKYSENGELVKKLEKALFYHNLAEKLLLGWISVMLILILLSSYIKHVN